MPATTPDAPTAGIREADHAAEPRLESSRVVHVVPALFGRGGTVGGAERYVYELARHMAEQVPTTLLTFGDENDETQHGRLRVRRLGRPWHVRGQRSNPFSVRLLRELRSADAVHCHQQHLVASTVAALFARATGRRVVCTDLGGGGWDLSSYVSTDRLFHEHLHISAYSRRVYGHEHWNRARVIYGGVDAGKFSPDARAERAVDCLFVGRLLPHKGVDVLLDAIPDEMSVVLAGPAPAPRYLDDLHARARGKNVRFVHDASDAAIVELYRSACTIVLPSVYRDCYGATTAVPELLGQTLLEGMACGAAGVCSQVASLPEVVEHGVTGLVVPPNDPRALREALLRLATRPADARRMGTAGRARVLERFTWQRTVTECLRSYGLTS
jgi:glycosyltransferase involved in cell wall biosynthesis